MHAHMQMHAHMHSCMHTLMHARTHRPPHAPPPHSPHIHPHPHAHTHTCTSMHTCMCTHTHTLLFSLCVVSNCNTLKMLKCVCAGLWCSHSPPGERERERDRDRDRDRETDIQTDRQTDRCRCSYTLTINAHWLTPLPHACTHTHRPPHAPPPPTPPTYILTHMHSCTNSYSLCVCSVQLQHFEGADPCVCWVVVFP